MTGNQKILDRIKLTEEQEKEDYRVELSGNNVLVWHQKNQIALLLPSPNIGRKVQKVVKERRKALKQVEAMTGWKPE